MAKQQIMRYPQGQRSVITLLEEYDNQSLESLRSVLNDRDYKRLFIARSVRSQLAACIGNPKDEKETRDRIVRDLMSSEDNVMGLGIGESMARKIVRDIFAHLAEASKMTRSVHRMIVARRNEQLYQMGLDKNDPDVMDKAINNDIKLFQLDKEDETKITLEMVTVNQLLSTLRYNDVKPGLGIDNLEEAIETARRKATVGIIDLKPDKSGTWTMEDMTDLEEPNKDIFDGEEDQSVLSE